MWISHRVSVFTLVYQPQPVLFKEYQNPLHYSKNSNIPTIIYISDTPRYLQVEIKWRKLKEKGKEGENWKEKRGSKGGKRRMKEEGVCKKNN